MVDLVAEETLRKEQKISIRRKPSFAHSSFNFSQLIIDH
jgi:hypothetical protein